MQLKGLMLHESVVNAVLVSCLHLGINTLL